MNTIRRLQALTTLSLTAALLACASVGNDSIRHETEQSIQARLVDGQTTKNQARKLFGPPIKTSFNDGGSEVWTYEFYAMQEDAISFVPVVNLFASSASGKKKELVLLFDRAGVLSRHAMVESEVKQRSGLLQ
jgi:outer membrane protein assembly factor BamE (lipoprotein component of BamABCDE complex)